MEDSGNSGRSYFILAFTQDGDFIGPVQSVSWVVSRVVSEETIGTVTDSLVGSVSVSGSVVIDDGSYYKNQIPEEFFQGKVNLYVTSIYPHKQKMLVIKLTDVDIIRSGPDDRCCVFLASGVERTLYDIPEDSCK